MIMQKVIFIPLIFCCYLSANAQTLEINFDSISQYIIIDSTANNVWQVGNTTKCFFGNYSSGEKVMITDTVNYYSSDNYSSFTLNFPFFMGEWNGVCMHVDYSLDSDTLKDGGYVEYSFDNDTNWTVLPNNLAEGNSIFNDTITGGTPAITGQHKLWSLDDCSCFFGSGYPKYRFVFKSDAIDNQRCGWSIYNIILNVIYCDGTGEIKTNDHYSNVYPNPVTDVSYLKINAQNKEIDCIQFFNSLGMLLKTLSPLKNDVAILREEFAEGLYLYRIQLQNGKIETGRFVID